MPKCPKCQSEVEATARFCNICGTDLTATGRCPGCGAELEPGALFCTVCGARVDTGKHQTVNHATPYPPVGTDAGAEVLPEDITFLANHFNGIISNGGRLHITPTEIKFNPHIINFNIKKYTWLIADVVKMEKGFLTNFYITFADGERHRFSLWKKKSVMNAINKRRAAMGLPPA